MRTPIKKRKIRHFRIRNKISGTAQKPRLAVFVSNKHFYAQIIDDVAQHTLVFCSTLGLNDVKGNNQLVAVRIGEEIATLAKKQKITEVVFDRGGFLFHGKVKAFADAARKNGLKF